MTLCTDLGQRSGAIRGGEARLWTNCLREKG
jgi:hypothetical protein